MITLLKAFLTRFFLDPQAFVGYVRAFVGVGGLFLATYGERIEAGLSPKYAGWVKGAGIVLGGLAFFIRAGDTTPENVKALAKSLTPPEGTAPVSPAPTP